MRRRREVIRSARTRVPALLDASWRLAENLIPKHIKTYDGERCFNLYTYLENLESELITVLDGAAIDQSPHQVARFLWACLASAAPEQPARTATSFNRMPILD